MALEVQQRLVPDLAYRPQHAVQLDRVERLPSPLEAFDVVELAGDVELGPAVPELPVGAYERGRVSGIRRVGDRAGFGAFGVVFHAGHANTRSLR